MTTPVVTVRPGDASKHAAALLVGHDIGALPVVNEHDDLVGIVTEASFLRLGQLADPRRHVLPVQDSGGGNGAVGELMTPSAVCVNEDEDVATIARLMFELHIRHVVVVDGLKVVGIISRRDLMKELARPDNEIAAELGARLHGEAGVIGNFVARVEDGVATLRGPSDARARELAALVTRSVRGITAVRFSDDG